MSTVLPFSGEKGVFFESGRAKFIEEARTLARFKSDPGVVCVHDFFYENGTAYIVMDYADGKTLKQLAAENGGKLPTGETLAYLYPVMDSLQRIHEAGLLHRDIAPDNIIIRSYDRRAVLLDFGAARQISAMGEHSNTINVKRGFAPEEQYRTHGQQGPWTDIYALCATIYVLTTGATPPNAVDRLSGDVAEPTLPNALGAAFTAAQQAALMKGLSVRGRDRQQSMAELKQSLAPDQRAQEKRVKDAERQAVAERSAQEKRAKQAAKQAERQAAAEQRAKAQRDRKARNAAAPETRRALSPLVKKLLVAVAACAVLAVGVLAVMKLLPRDAGKIAAVAESTPVPTMEQTTTPAAAAQDDTAEDAAAAGLLYAVEDGAVTITGYTGLAEEVEIPAPIDGLPVTRIGEGAFFQRFYVKNVTIPASVSSIADRAFSGCTALTGITIPDGVTEIGSDAFLGCSMMREIVIPDSVTSIGDGAFWECELLTEVTIPDSVKAIGDNAFELCEKMKKVSIPQGVTRIGAYAFYSCNSLKDVLIPGSVTSIGAGAFYGCKALERVTIRDGAKDIDNSAFRDCSKLTEIAIPASVTSIGAKTFEGCANITIACPAASYAEWYAADRGIPFQGGALSAAEALPADDSSDTWVKRMMFEDKYAVEVAYAGGRTLTVTLTDPDLKETYPINQPTTAQNMLEYVWRVALSDGSARLKLGTSHYKFEEKPKTVGLDGMMQNSLWLYAEDRWKHIADASMETADKQIQWTVDIPTDVAFDFSSVEITGVDIKA